MSRSITTILGLGVVCAIFMALMSMFYLQQIPTAEDLERLEDDLRREHSLCLSAFAEVQITLIRPQREGERTGLDVQCTLQPHIRRKDPAVRLHLGRIAETALHHPDWHGRLAYVTVRHAPPLDAAVTRYPVAETAESARR